MKKKHIQVTAAILVVVVAALAFLLSQCDPSKARYAHGWERYIYPRLSGKVVDADTGAPVEGAVVFCIWTITYGFPGFTHEVPYIIAESVTGQDGHFTLAGTWNPFVDPPELSVYKKGYVLWNINSVFPSMEHRRDFSWKSGVTMRLEKWKQEYSYDSHQFFAGSHPPFSKDNPLQYRFFLEMKWEKEQANRERNNKAIQEGRR